MKLLNKAHDFYPMKQVLAAEPDQTERDLELSARGTNMLDEMYGLEPTRVAQPMGNIFEESRL
jgi:hypothetical protein